MDILLEFILNEDKCEAQTFQMRCERISSRLIYLNWKRVYFSVEFCACSFVYRTQSASPERVHSLSLLSDTLMWVCNGIMKFCVLWKMSTSDTVQSYLQQCTYLNCYLERLINFILHVLTYLCCRMENYLNVAFDTAYERITTCSELAKQSYIWLK